MKKEWMNERVKENKCVYMLRMYVCEWKKDSGVKKREWKCERERYRSVNEKEYVRGKKERERERKNREREGGK